MADPSGTLIDRTEIEDEGGVRIVRRWHPNGTLVEEQRCKILPDGSFQPDGTSRRWNSEGKLIGSFEIMNGTGILSNWYDNGQLQFESSLVDGAMTGMQRCWDEGGYLLTEKFYYRGGAVSKKRYRELQEHDLSIPQYNDADFRTVAQKRKDKLT